MSIVRIPLSRIDDNPYQPRTTYAGIEELADSIDKNGLLQYPVARLVDGKGRMARDEKDMPLGAAGGAVYGYLKENPEWRLQLAYGHRRIRAMRLLADRRGEDEGVTVPIRMKIMTDEEMARHVGIENANRENLNPVERARYIERIREEFGYTMAEVGELFGKARSTISNWLRILKLPDNVLEHMAEGEITERQAQALLPAFDLPDELAAIQPDIPDVHYHVSPSRLVELAIDGESSSELRKWAKKIVRNVEIWKEQYVDEPDGAAAERSRANAAEPSSDPYAPMSADFEKPEDTAEPGRKTIVLVACSKSKLTMPAMAAGLYQGALYKKCRDYAKKLVRKGEADAWYILSAKHGLVEPREMLDPYDETLSDMDADERHQWARAVSNGLVLEASGADEARTLIILGGRDYWEPIRRFYEPFPEEDTPEIVTPFEGMAGNGEMMQWLERQCDNAADAGGDGVASDGIPSEPELAATSAARTGREEISSQSDWPEPKLDPVWRELPHMTKAELEETHRTFRHEQWGRYSDNFRTSALKEEQFAHVKAQVRYHANLEAVHRLTDEQAARLLGWMREKTGDKFYYSGDHPEAMRPAHTILRSIREVKELGIMAEDALDRFQLREARRAGAFCYHVFYEEQTGRSLSVAGPPTCEELQERYPQATQMQGPAAARALKEIRADIGRRQGVTEDLGELDRLSELHADVDRALDELAERTPA